MHYVLWPVNSNLPVYMWCTHVLCTQTHSTKTCYPCTASCLLIQPNALQIITSWGFSSSQGKSTLHSQLHQSFYNANSRLCRNLWRSWWRKWSTITQIHGRKKRCFLLIKSWSIHQLRDSQGYRRPNRLIYTSSGQFWEWETGGKFSGSCIGRSHGY